MVAKPKMSRSQKKALTVVEKTITEKVKDDPIKTAAIAFGVGVAVGTFLAAMVRRK